MSPAWTWMPMSAVASTARSPRPVRVGVATRWPAPVRIGATRSQHQPPCQPPCTSTNVTMAPRMLPMGVPVNSPWEYCVGRAPARPEHDLVRHPQPALAAGVERLRVDPADGPQSALLLAAG